MAKKTRDAVCGVHLHLRDRALVETLLWRRATGCFADTRGFCDVEPLLLLLLLRRFQLLLQLTLLLLTMIGGR